MPAEFQSDFWECSFLVNAESELQKHEQVALKNAKVFQKKFEHVLSAVTDRFDAACSEKRLTEVLSNIRRSRRERDVSELKLAKGEDSINNIYHECNTVRSQNEELQNEVLSCAQELEQLREKISSLKQDAEIEAEKFRVTYEATLIAKDEYKKCLECHVRFCGSDEGGDTYIFTFEKAVMIGQNDPNSMLLKSVKLHYNKAKKYWKLLETNPALSNFSELATKLEKSQDLKGFLAYLRPIMKTK